MTQLYEENGTMNRIHELFLKRDEEYQRMEETFEKRRAQFTLQEDLLNKKEKDLEEREKNLLFQEEEMKKKRNHLGEKEVFLNNREAELENRSSEFEQKIREEYMNLTILREEARNEKIEANRMKEEYTCQLSSLKTGAAEETVNYESVLCENERLKVQLAAYEEEIVEFRKKLLQMDNLIRLLEDQNKEIKNKLEEIDIQHEDITKENYRLKQENEELKKQKDQLYQEKKDLFQKLMFGEEENVKMDNETVGQFVQSLETSDFGDGAPDELDISMNQGLTAETLYAFLQENGRNACILHTLKSEIVQIPYEDLIVNICFGSMPHFAIHKRSDGRRAVKNAIRQFNEEQSKLHFEYDDFEKEVLCEAPFFLDISPNELLTDISAVVEIYFNQKYF